MYEMEGMLCRHLIRVRELFGATMNRELLTLPGELILSRYTRGAKDGVSLTEGMPEEAHPDVAKYNLMNSLMAIIRTQVSNDMDLTDIVIESLIELARKVSKT
ncbi:hypothetical protein LINGRAHAP2_LOCUS10878, partial [Linum grandiflorum]